MQGCRILLVGDCSNYQHLMSFPLRKVGVQVEVAENVYSAMLSVLDAGIEGSFRGILFDMEMPVSEGCDVVSMMRSSGFRGSIVAVLDDTMRRNREKCLAAGCNECVIKPIDRVNLIKLISSLASIPTCTMTEGQ